MSAAPPAPARGSRSDREGWSRFAGDHEAILAAALIGTFVAIAALCTGRGLPHSDEVMYAETSANIAAGRGAVAWTHANVVPGTPNAVTYVPFVWAEAGWLRLFGPSRRAVECFGIAVVAAAAWTWWAFLARVSLLRSPAARLLLAAGLPMVASVTKVWATNRYDMIAILGMALAAWASTLRTPSARIASLWLAGMLVGSDGFHPALIAPGLAVVAWWWGGRRATRDLIAFVAGVAAGLALTFGEMWASGTLGVFRTLMQHNGVEVRSLPKVLAAPFARHSNVLGNALTLAASAIALLSGWIRRGSPTASRAGVAGLGVGLLVPMILTFVGRYNQTYAWLAVAPCLVLGAMATEDDAVGGPARRAIGALLALTVLVGLPTRAAMLALEAEVNSSTAADAYVLDHLDADDVAYASYALYYPVKARAAESFFGGAIDSMTPAQLASVDTAVLADDAKPRGLFEVPQAETLARLGGEWEEIGHFRTPRGRWRTMLPVAPKEAAIFDFRVFRRTR